MVYKTKQEKMGLTISISSHRKHGNGAVGGGRKNKSGKKAVVSREGCDDIIITGNTTKGLLREVRSKFNIPPNIQISGKGETRI